MKILVTQKQLTNLVENKEKIILNESQFTSSGTQWFEPLGKIDFDIGGMAAREYGAPRPGGRKHPGYDVGASNGTPLYSIADGTVIEARPTSTACGPGVVHIDHGGGIKSRFCHVTNINVKKGDKIKGGCQFGTVGEGHMHIEIYHPNSPNGRGSYMNPRVFHDVNNFIKHNGEYCGSELTPYTEKEDGTLSFEIPGTSRSKQPTPIDDTYFTKKGDVNEERVEVLQEILTAAGYETEVDGDYGNLTMDSVREVKDDLDIDTVATYVLNKELIKIVNHFGEIQGDEIEINGKKLPIDLSKVTSDTTTTTTTSTTRPSDKNRATAYARNIILDVPNGAYGESFNLIYGSTDLISSGYIRELFLESNPNEFKQHNFIFADKGTSLSKIKRFIKDELGTSSDPNIDTITLVGASATNFTENPSGTYDRYFFVQPYLTKKGLSAFNDKSPNYSNVTVLSNPNFFKSNVEQFDSLKVLNDIVIRGGGDVETGTEGTIAMLKSFFKNYYNPL